MILLFVSAISLWLTFMILSSSLKRFSLKRSSMNRANAYGLAIIYNARKGKKIKNERWFTDVIRRLNPPKPSTQSPRKRLIRWYRRNLGVTYTTRINVIFSARKLHKAIRHHEYINRFKPTR